VGKTARRFERCRADPTSLLPWHPPASVGPVTRRRTVNGLALLLSCGALAAGAAACNPSKPRDINFGTEAGADFEVPPDSQSSFSTPDGATDTGSGASSDTGATTADGDVDAGVDSATD
jgi:hypothetical protein